MYRHQKKNIHSVWFPLFSLLALTALLTACVQEGQGNSAKATIQATSSSSPTASHAITPTPGSSQSSPPSYAITPTPGSRQSSTPSSVPLTIIHMIDSSNGWALSVDSILKTTNGGQSWTDVTPVNVRVDTASTGDFFSAQYAWIATPTAYAVGKSVVVLRTTNGGANWQSTTINDVESISVDMPHFVSTQQGWLQLFPRPGYSGTDIWHSSDGGATWQKIQKSGSEMPVPSGLSFADTQNGIEAGRTAVYEGDDTVPGVSVTHDGGATWSIQLLNLPTGVSRSDVSDVATTSPIFFGSTALLPVHIIMKDGSARFELYRSSNDGSSWSQTTVANIQASAVYVYNQNDVWATDSATGKLYATTNGGAGWYTVSTTAYNFTALSFVSATNGWGISKSGFFSTTDGGKTWTKISYSIS